MELLHYRGYYLVASAKGFNIIKQVSSINIRILFDIYHQQMSANNIINSILSNIKYMSHFHALGNLSHDE